MKEEYLHQIWKKKTLPFHLMRLTDGRDFTIKNVGKYNIESGPDFFNGEIIIDGICWRGNIEMHVKSSDWYLHKHQFDPAYNNVILHVVYEYDKEVMINDRCLPTLELKEFIRMEHSFNSAHSKLVGSDFPCRKFIRDIDSIYLESMKENAIIRSLERKLAFLQSYNEPETAYNQILYRMLGRAFGMKINSVPFQELTNRLPLKIIKRERIEYTDTLLIGTSGIRELDPEEKDNWLFLSEKYNLGSMSRFVWKSKGLRSNGFPPVRLRQFSEVIKKFDFDTSFTYLEADLTIDHLYALLDLTGSDQKLSDSTKDLLIINCFSPFIWWFGQTKNNPLLMEKAIDILFLLKPEKNRIVQKWSEMGVKLKNAYDSQALLEIYNEFCSEKKCLYCTVGNKIMKG